MRVTYCQVTKEEVLLAKEWEQYQWVMAWLRIFRKHEDKGVIF